MKLIGIHGRARSGKDTVANYLVKQYGFVRNAFADPLKRAGQQMFGLTEAETFDEKLKEVDIPYWGMSPRTMFQKLGTEGGRNVFGDDLWLKRWNKFYIDFGSHADIVVPDVRFDNEADLVRSLGGHMVYVVSGRSTPLTVAAQAHASERGIRLLDEDLRISNDGTIAQLHEGIDVLLDCIGGAFAT